MGDLGLHGGGVGGLGDLARLEFGAGLANLLGLRERADGGGRKGRQTQRLALLLDALGERGRPAIVALFEGAEPLLHARPVNQLAHGARRPRRVGALELLLRRLLAALQNLFQSRQFAQLLLGERHPLLDARVKLLLQVQVLGRVQQRAAGRKPQVVAQLARDGLEPLGQSAQIGRPHIAPVDHAQAQRLVVRPFFDKGVHLLGRANAIDVQAVDGQLFEHRQALFDGAEISAQNNLHARLGQLLVSGGKSAEPLLFQIHGQNGLIELRPHHALVAQLAQNRLVSRSQRRQQRQPVERLPLDLSQTQQGHGPQQRGLGVDPGRLGLARLGDDLRGVG